MPQRVRGYLFEYETIKLSQAGPVIWCNDRIYKPGADTFEIFKESEEPQTMPYPTEDIEDSHKAWQKAMGKCNALSI